MAMGSSLTGETLWPHFAGAVTITDTFAPTGRISCAFQEHVFGNSARPQSDFASVNDIDQHITSLDQLLPIADGCHDMTLFDIIQQQQQLGTPSAEEQQIDSQIEHLLQIKAQMQASKQAQQPVVLDPLQTSPFYFGASTGLVSPTPSIALDSTMASPSTTMDAGQEWPWLGGSSAAAVAAAVPARHSIDLGGLALRMAACDLNNSRTSFSNLGGNLNGSSTFQSADPNLNDSFSMQPADHYTLAAALSAAAATELNFTVTAPVASTTAALISPPVVPAAPIAPTASNIYLQSALYMPAELPTARTTVGLNAHQPIVGPRNALPRAPLAGRPREPRRRSLDISRLQGYGGWSGSTSGTAAAAAGGHTAGPMDAVQPAAAPGYNRDGSHLHARPRRASVDFPSPLRTSDGRRPPRKIASMLPNMSYHGSSSRDPLTNHANTGPLNPHNHQQQEGSDLGEPSRQGLGTKALSSRVDAPRRAGSQWNPMADVAKDSQLGYKGTGSKGTGVFIPGAAALWRLSQVAEAATA